MAEKMLNIELATPTQNISFEQALSCSASGAKGKFQVLPRHTGLISELTIGEVKVDIQDEIRYFSISGGFLEVFKNRVLLLLESAEAANDIDVKRAHNAKERAASRLERSDSSLDIIRAEAALRRAINRLQVARKFSTS